MLKEAKRLHDLGWAIHWIKPNSKAPVKAGWTTGPRDEWSVLQKEYREGYGLGVRMGEASALGKGFLANIDIDIKSTDARHRKEALAFVENHFPGLMRKAPWVKTGYGIRVFVCTTKPFESRRLGASSEEVKVKMPNAEANKRQRAALSEKEIKDGWRIRSAWEIDAMSTGRQVVLPPSVHPETGKLYTWGRAVTANDAVPLVDPPPGKSVKADKADEKNEKTPFCPVDVDLDIAGLSAKMIRMIVDGEGAEDNSAMMLPAACAMCELGLTDNEILSVLTDKDYVLGAAAYRHTSSGSRRRAAEWVRKYTLHKAREETDAKNVFDEVVEIIEGGKPKKLKLKLDRTEKGGVRQTLDNVVAVLTAVSPAVFKRDLFLSRDHYGCDTPWGGISGKALTDDDAILIKKWMSEKFGFEPSTGLVFEAQVWIATKNGYHPVRNELEALPPWDGVPRLDTWFKRCFNAKGDPDYLAQVFRKWLVASITRIYEPGAKFDWIPILEGNQGVGKSTFGAILFGQGYFSDWLPDLSDKDAALQLQGKRCVEFGELHSLRRTELEAAKAFITRQIDNVRPPYGRRSVETPRQTVFFGTTDKETYLKDEAGNRRFNPVRVGKLDFGALASERDQLWAEALFIYQNKLESSLYLEGTAATFAKVIQDSKMVEDESTFMVEAIQKCMTENTEFDFSRFKLVSLFGSFGPLEKWRETMDNLRSAGKAIRKLGGVKYFANGHAWWKMG